MVANALAATESAEVVVLQHEYGIYPGRDGDRVLELVSRLRAPLVTVLHTVLDQPTARQRDVLKTVLGRSQAAVVQSRAAADRLTGIGLGACPVVVIPHGATANFEPVAARSAQPTVLTWGLLGPGKGVEHGIAAVARLSGHRPAPRYVVAGRTHQKVLAGQGDAYRRSLARLADQLGVAGSVVLDDGYRSWEELRRLVRAADVVLLPYDSRDQVSSGVLVEALASGRPVVATRFPHAEELLASAAGLLVSHGDVEAMARALDEVLYSPGRQRQLAVAARRIAQALLWPAVGRRYRELVLEVAWRAQRR